MGESPKIAEIKSSKTLALILIFSMVLGILPVAQIPDAKAVSSSSVTSHGLSDPRNENGTVTWDCVWFGNYPQSDATGEMKEPIKWRVLSVNGDDAFLLADTNLDVQKYNDTQTSVTWETCTMRTWLNSTFLNNAFNASEQTVIQNTTVVNEDNPDYGTEGGEDTVDKVFLLSISEAMNPSYGFTSTMIGTKTRQAKNTAYAKAQGAYTDTSTGYEENGYWWLRSPGSFSNLVSYVDNLGDVSQYGGYVCPDNVAVRPALHLNLRASSDALSASSWSYAGTVSSDKVLALKLEAKPKSLQASWKKVSGAAGYQIWISTSKKFKKKSVKTTKKRKLTVRKLKSGKMYYVKVRDYTVTGGKKVYGAWSKTVKKRVK